MIKVESLTVEREGNTVICDISLSWHKGEKIALLGPNGAGKTTLALALSGIIVPESGYIYIDSQPISDYSLTDLRKKIGIVFQDPETQFVTTDVSREIAFGLSNIESDPDEIFRRVDYIIEKLNLFDLINRDTSNLSGGEKQLVAMSSIYAMSPDYIVFDEVTSFLDRRSRERIYKLWEDTPSGLLIITQNFEEIKWADRVILLENGKISFESEADTLLKKNIIHTPEAVFRTLLDENKDFIPEYQQILEILG